ncbi:hypothetical protein GALMADRAFT_885131 [Galerina marginata CBS 339.88]|uniref:Uncharacterized protein n=1 Tax=Galerina marginata (strain CBS 339.88) TaxID=685588 RepID=A0A067SHQ3_GALM3|nr:hypothetical protein GALMADRAFT_885131 [Galerina marginata CBS 339.88]
MWPPSSYALMQLVCSPQLYFGLREIVALSNSRPGILVSVIPLPFLVYPVLNVFKHKLLFSLKVPSISSRRW